MKKTAIVAITVVALVFGVAAFAGAQTESVTVTAKVNPAFSMTLDANSFAFADTAPGSTQTITGPEVTVKSNKTYTYSLEAVTVSGPDAASEAAILPLQSQSESVSQGTKGARGVSKMAYDYSLDLTSDAAYDAEAGDYTFTYGYTAVQN